MKLCNHGANYPKRFYQRTLIQTEEMTYKTVGVKFDWKFRLFVTFTSVLKNFKNFLWTPLSKDADNGTNGTW